MPRRRAWSAGVAAATGRQRGARCPRFAGTAHSTLAEIVGEDGEIVAVHHLVAIEVGFGQVAHLVRGGAEAAAEQHQIDAVDAAVLVDVARQRSPATRNELTTRSTVLGGEARSRERSPI